MPQQTLLPGNPPMTKVTLEITDRTPELVDGCQVIVRVQTAGGILTTVAALRLEGRQSDYLDTLVTEVVSAWHYGEGPRDVATAAASVHKVARRHARAHDRQGALRGI